MHGAHGYVIYLLTDSRLAVAGGITYQREVYHCRSRFLEAVLGLEPLGQAVGRHAFRFICPLEGQGLPPK